jgi:hypothetical protein
MHEELAQIGMDVGEMQRAVAGVVRRCRLTGVKTRVESAYCFNA